MTRYRSFAVCLLTRLKCHHSLGSGWNPASFITCRSSSRFSRSCSVSLPCATSTASSVMWAFHTLKEDPSYLRKPELVAMLTPSQREEISWPETVRDFGFIPDSWYGNDYEAWGPKFSSSVMSWILKKDYLYYAADMAERLAMHIPSHLRNLIKAKAASSAEASPSMNEFCSKMLEFMDLKSEIDTLLNEK